MNRTIGIIVVVFVSSLGVVPRAFAQTAPPAAPNAADLYVRAAKLIVAYSPADTAYTYPSYPPYGDQWEELEKNAFTKDAAAFDLLRRARSLDRAEWGADMRAFPTTLNAIRSPCNELNDAATYQHVHGNDAGAFETVQDAFHMGAMLRQNMKPHEMVRAVLGDHCDAGMCVRILVMAPEVRLSADPNDAHALQVAVAGQIINILMDQTNPVAESLGPNKTASDATLQRQNEAFSRDNAERTFAAMAQAAQLFRFDQHHWPVTLDDLVPSYLSRKPVDPWGDGKQTFGYVLIKGGLPDGGDRPLVYDRCWSDGALFYRVDGPQYWFYGDDGSKIPMNLQKNGGQFRDLAMWHPVPRPAGTPTTQPLEQ